jgi:flagellum-specific ATP synthase
MASVSRLMTELASPLLQKCAAKLRELMATYKNSEDLINIGAYVAGSNPRIDQAIRMIGSIKTFLRQSVNEPSTLESAVEQVTTLMEGEI